MKKTKLTLISLLIAVVVLAATPFMFKGKAPVSDGRFSVPAVSALENGASATRLTGGPNNVFNPTYRTGDTTTPIETRWQTNSVYFLLVKGSETGSFQYKVGTGLWRNVVVDDYDLAANGNNYNPDAYKNYTTWSFNDAARGGIIFVVNYTTSANTGRGDDYYFSIGGNSTDKFNVRIDKSHLQLGTTWPAIMLNESAANFTANPGNDPAISGKTNADMGWPMRIAVQNMPVCGIRAVRFFTSNCTVTYTNNAGNLVSGATGTSTNPFTLTLEDSSGTYYSAESTNFNMMALAPGNTPSYSVTVYVIDNMGRESQRIQMTVSGGQSGNGGGISFPTAAGVNNLNTGVWKSSGTVRIQALNGNIAANTLFYSCDGSDWALINFGASAGTVNIPVGDGSPYGITKNGAYFFKFRQTNGQNPPNINYSAYIISDLDSSTPGLMIDKNNDAWMKAGSTVYLTANASPSGVRGIEVRYSASSATGPWTLKTPLNTAADSFKGPYFSIDDTGYYQFTLFNNAGRSVVVGTAERPLRYNVDKTTNLSLDVERVYTGGYDSSTIASNVETGDLLADGGLEQVGNTQGVSVGYNYMLNDEVSFNLFAQSDYSSDVPVSYYYAISYYDVNSNSWSIPSGEDWVLITAANGGTPIAGGMKFTPATVESNTEYKFRAVALGGEAAVSVFEGTEENHYNPVENEFLLLFAPAATAVSIGDLKIFEDWQRRDGGNVVDLHVYVPILDDLREPYWIEYRTGLCDDLGNLATNPNWSSWAISATPGEFVRRTNVTNYIAFEFRIVTADGTIGTIQKIYGPDKSKPTAGYYGSKQTPETPVLINGVEWVSYIEIYVVSEQYTPDNPETHYNYSGALFQYSIDGTTWLDLVLDKDYSYTDDGNRMGIIRLGIDPVTNKEYAISYVDSGYIYVRAKQYADTKAEWSGAKQIPLSSGVNTKKVDGHVGFVGTPKNLGTSWTNAATSPREFPIHVQNGGSGFKRIWITDYYTGNVVKELVSNHDGDFNDIFEITENGRYLLRVTNRLDVTFEPYEFQITNIDNTFPLSEVSFSATPIGERAYSATLSAVVSVSIDTAHVAPSGTVFWYSEDHGVTWNRMNQNVPNYYATQTFSISKTYQLMFRALTNAGVAWVSEEYTLTISSEALRLMIDPEKPLDRTPTNVDVIVNFVTDPDLNQDATIYISYDDTKTGLNKFTNSASETWITLAQYYTLIGSTGFGGINPRIFAAKENWIYYFQARLGEKVSESLEVNIYFIERTLPAFNVIVTGGYDNTVREGVPAENWYSGPVRFDFVLNADVRSGVTYYVRTSVNGTTWTTAQPIVADINGDLYYMAQNSGYYRFSAESGAGQKFPLSGEDTNGQFQFKINIDEDPPVIGIIGYSIGGDSNFVRFATPLTLLEWADLEKDWTNQNIIVYFNVILSTSLGTVVRTGGGSGTTLNEYLSGTGNPNITGSITGCTHYFEFAGDGAIDVYVRGYNGLNSETATVVMENAIDKLQPGFDVNYDKERNKWISEELTFTLSFGATDITLSGATVYVVAIEVDAGDPDATLYDIEHIGNNDSRWFNNLLASNTNGAEVDYNIQGVYAGKTLKAFEGQYYYRFMIRSGAGEWRMSSYYLIMYDPATPVLTINNYTGDYVAEFDLILDISFDYDEAVDRTTSLSGATISVTRPDGMTVSSSLGSLSADYRTNGIYITGGVIKYRVTMNGVWNDAEGTVGYIFRLVTGAGVQALDSLGNQGIKVDVTKIDNVAPEFVVTPGANVGIWTNKTVTFEFTHTNTDKVGSGVTYYYSEANNGTGLIPYTANSFNPQNISTFSNGIGRLDKTYYFYAVSGVGNRSLSYRGPYRVMIDTYVPVASVAGYGLGDNITDSGYIKSALNQLALTNGWSQNSITVYIKVTGLPIIDIVKDPNFGWDDLRALLKVVPKDTNAIGIIDNTHELYDYFYDSLNDGEYIFYYVFTKNETVTFRATGRSGINSVDLDIPISIIDTNKPTFEVTAYTGSTGTLPSQIYYTNKDDVKWTNTGVLRFVFSVKGTAALSPTYFEYTTADINKFANQAAVDSSLTWSRTNIVGNAFTLNAPQNEIYYFRLVTDAGHIYYLRDADTKYTQHIVRINTDVPVFGTPVYGNNGAWVAENVVATYTVTFAEELGKVTIGNIPQTEKSWVFDEETKTVTATYEYTLSRTSLADNSKVTVTAINPNGREVTLILSTDRIDYIRPVVTAAATVNGSTYDGNWTNSNVTITLTSLIPLSNYKYQWTRNDKFENTSINDPDVWSDIGFVGNVFTVTEIVSGTYQYYFRIVSEVNTSSPSEPVEIKISKQTPGLDTVVYEDGRTVWTDRDITVTFTITFDGAEPAADAVKAEGKVLPGYKLVEPFSAYSLAETFTYVYTYTFEYDPVYSATGKSVIVTATNPNGMTDSWTFEIDGPPTFTVASVGDLGAYLSGNEGTFTDEGVELRFALTGNSASHVIIQYWNDTTQRWEKVTDDNRYLIINSTGNVKKGYYFRSRSEAMLEGEYYYYTSQIGEVSIGAYSTVDNLDDKDTIKPEEIELPNGEELPTAWDIYIRSGSSTDPVIKNSTLPTDRWYLGGGFDDITITITVTWSDPTYRTDKLIDGDYVRYGTKNPDGTIKWEGVLTNPTKQTQGNDWLYSFTITERRDYYFQVYDADLASSLGPDAEEEDAMSSVLQIQLSNIYISSATPEFTVKSDNATSDVANPDNANPKWHNGSVSFSFELTNANNVPSGVVYYYTRSLSGTITWNIISGTTFTVSSSADNGTYYFIAVLKSGPGTATDTNPGSNTDVIYTDKDLHIWYVNISTVTPKVEMVGYSISGADTDFVATSDITALDRINWTNKNIKVYIKITYATANDTVTFSGQEAWTASGQSYSINKDGTSYTYTDVYVFKKSDDILRLQVLGANNIPSNLFVIQPIRLESPTLPPTLSVSAPNAGDAWQPDNVVFNFTAGLTNSPSGLSEYQYRRVNDEDDFNNMTPDQGWIKIPIDSGVHQWTVTENGYYQFRVKTVAGNVSVPARSFRVRVDTTAPIITDITYSKSTWLNTEKEGSLKVWITVEYSAASGRHASDPIFPANYVSYTNTGNVYTYEYTFSANTSFTVTANGANRLSDQRLVNITWIDSVTPELIVTMRPRTGTDVEFDLTLNNTAAMVGPLTFWYQMKPVGGVYGEWKQIGPAGDSAYIRFTQPTDTGEYKFRVITVTGIQGGVILGRYDEEGPIDFIIDLSEPDLKIVEWNEQTEGWDEIDDLEAYLTALVNANRWSAHEIQIVVRANYTGGRGTLTVTGPASRSTYYDENKESHDNVATHTYFYSVTIGNNGTVRIEAKNPNGGILVITLLIDKHVPAGGNEIDDRIFDIEMPNLAVDAHGTASSNDATRIYFNGDATFTLTQTNPGVLSTVTYYYARSTAAWDAGEIGTTWKKAVFDAKGNFVVADATAGHNGLYRFIAVSESGLVSETSDWYVDIDKTLPKFSNEIYSNNGQWTNQDVIVTFTVTYTGRKGSIGTLTNLVRLSDSDDGLTEIWQYTFKSNNSVIITATNANGRQDTLSLSTDKIDKTALKLTATSDTAGRTDGAIWYNGSVVFIFSTNTVGSPVTYQYHNGTNWVAFEPGKLAYNAANNTYVYTITPAGANGGANNGQYRFRAVSESGEVSNEETYWVNIDTTLPKFSNVDYKNNGQWTNQDVVVTFTVTYTGKAGSIGTLTNLVRLSVSNGGLTEEWQYTFKSNGSVTVTATNANNRRDTLNLSTDKIDKAPLALTVVTATASSTNGEIWVNGNVTFNISTNVVGSPVTFQYYKNNDWVAFEEGKLVYDNTKGVYVYTIAPAGTNGGGNNGQYQFRAVSASGEVSNTETYWVNIDTGSPTFSNITYNNYNGQNYVYTAGSITVQFTVTYTGAPSRTDPLALTDKSKGALAFISSSQGGLVQVWSYTFTANDTVTVNAINANGRLTPQAFTTSYIDTVELKLIIEATNAVEATQADKWTRENINFNFALEQAPQSPVIYEYSHDRIAWTKITLVASAWTITDPQNKIYHFRAKSEVGKVSNIASYKVQIDRQSPELKIIGYYIGNIEAGEKINFSNIIRISKVSELPTAPVNQSITVFVELIAPASGAMLVSLVTFSEYVGFIGAKGRVFQYTFINNAKVLVRPESTTGVTITDMVIEITNINKEKPVVTGLVGGETLTATQINYDKTFTSNIEITIKNADEHTIVVRDNTGKLLDIEWVGGVYTFTKTGSYRMTVTDTAGNVETVFFDIQKPNWVLIGSTIGGGTALLTALALVLVFFIRNRRALKRLREAAMMNDDAAKFVMFKRVK